MNRRNNPIKLNDDIKAEVISIAVDGISTAYRHICKLKSLPSGHRLYYHGVLISMKNAVRQRRFCMRMCKLALRGIIY